MLLKRLVIVTGLSGSGKSSVLDLLEDQGLFTVDNLPAIMLPELVHLLSDSEQSRENGIAAGIDARSVQMLDDFPRVLSQLRSQNIPVQVLFLEASEDVITQRYSFTRRRHPLGFMTSLIDGIRTERLKLAPLRMLADRVIDTSALTPQQLNNEILEILGRNTFGLQVLITSFGFKYGSPKDADFVFDVRFLANPYYEPQLRNLSGKDEKVRCFIYQHNTTNAFLRQCLELLETILPVYHCSGKNYLHIAVGCTGGRHRSVFVAEWLAERLSRIEGVSCLLKHRDIDKDVGGIS